MSKISFTIIIIFLVIIVVFGLFFIRQNFKKKLLSVKIYPTKTVKNYPTISPSENPIISPDNLNINDKSSEAVWEKEIKNMEVNPSTENCSGKSPLQEFSARLSKQFPNTGYKGTFLHLSGSPTIAYISDINHPRYASRKLLEYKLWKSGFRILELKFSSKTGWEPSNHPDEQWRSAGLTCETEPLVKALKIMEEKGMWPKISQNRFAMGTSNGAMLLAYAIDFYKSPYVKMNRVLLQSPVAYDIYSQCEEMPVSQFTDFYFGDKCRNFDDNKDFFMNQSIKFKLNSDNCAMTADKNSYLIVFGAGEEIPAWYKDESQRYVPDREKLCPIKTAFWDAPVKYEGHSPIIDFYRINGNIEPFVNYFLTGEVDFY